MTTTRRIVNTKPAASGNKTSASTIAKVIPNAEFDKATQDFLNASYGSEAAWYNDSQIGPVLKAALTAGSKGTALQGQQYQDFIRTHAVNPANPTGKVIKVAPNQSWYGTHGAAVRQTFGQKISDVGTYNENVKNTLAADVTPVANSLGISFDQATLQKVAEDAYTNGWKNTDQIKAALLAQYHYTANTDPNATPIGGDVGRTQSSFAQIATEYQVPLPKDPAKMDAFIKGAIGPGGSEQAFTEYAKQVAAARYPFMADQILNQGVKPSAYFQPIESDLINTLDLAPGSVNWQDPKWESLLTKTDVSGKVVGPANRSDIMNKVKNDPQYGYDNTVAGKADAANFGEGLKSMFGF